VKAADFGAIYEAHYPDVHRFILHLVQDVSLADELTQDAFVHAFEGRDSFRGEAPERLWLLRVARNVTLDYLRSPRSRRRDVASLDEETGEQPATPVAGAEPCSAEEAARQVEMSGCVQQFVLSLPETLRTPLVLHDVEGLTNEQIAEVLGCSLSAAKMRLHRARAALRGLMEQRCDLFRNERNVLSCLPTDSRDSPLFASSRPCSPPTTW
jgi:RNA polymerase sigma-70 factor (ECF subfamily)